VSDGAVRTRASEPRRFKFARLAANRQAYASPSRIHAASIASLLLTTEAVITQIPEKNRDAAMPGRGWAQECTKSTLRN
jgi:hypothetical protein